MRRRTAVSLAAAAAAAAAALTLSSPAAPQAARTAACAGTRADVKTLTDADAGSVDFTPATATVDALRSFERPDNLDARVEGVETTTYKVKAGLVAMKLGQDGAIDLVISQPHKPTHAMTVELPAASCTTGSSRRTAMKDARTALTKACGPARAASVHLQGKATISGVGFFGPGGLELAPSVGFDLTSASCKRG